MKVAHHGSRNSSSEEFLKLVRPEFAFISSGKKSRYGHPHVDLLERLQRIGAEVKITAESGAITIKTDGARMIVEEYIR
jgi:competence protein ComEC